MDSDNAEHPHGRNPANRTPAEAMRHNPCFGIMKVMPNRHKIHATGHSSRLNREGITLSTKFGSELYCREELIAELGAAFLSNEAGILSQVQFENSAAYLNSWIQKLEKDPRLIVSAASQAQRGSDFIRGIEHKETLQGCQMSPEGMPHTWAKENGIDTRIPGFVHRDNDGDGVSKLLEWKHGTRPTDRLSGPFEQGMSL